MGAVMNDLHMRFRRARHRHADRGHVDQVGDQLRVERTDASASGTGATMIDWSNLIERLHLFERLGAERYNELNAEHLKQQTVATVNGHAIRRVQTRFGEIYFVSGTDCAFALLSEARAFARGLS
jgi:hypothetical protein